jgi:hypothetical protein
MHSVLSSEILFSITEHGGSDDVSNLCTIGRFPTLRPNTIYSD